MIRPGQPNSNRAPRARRGAGDTARAEANLGRRDAQPREDAASASDAKTEWQNRAGQNLQQVPLWKTDANSNLSPTPAAARTKWKNGHAIPIGIHRIPSLSRRPTARDKALVLGAGTDGKTSRGPQTARKPGDLKSGPDGWKIFKEDDMNASTKPLSRGGQLYLVGFSLFLAAIGMIATGFVLWLGAEKGGGGSRTFLAVARREWANVHLCFSLSFCALAATHFIQHWRWVRTVTPRQAGWKVNRRGALRLVAATVAVLSAVSILYCAFREDFTPGGNGSKWSGVERARSEAEESGPGLDGGGGRGWRGGRGRM
jgi:hypothetical protein